MTVDFQIYVSSHPNYVDTHYEMPETHKGVGTIKLWATPKI